MAMIKAKQLERYIQRFKIQHGRAPTFEELRKYLAGR